MSLRKLRFDLLFLALLAALVLGAVALAPRTLINETASMPRGLYWREEARLTKGEVVAFPVPDSVRALVVDRHYLRPGAVMVKAIAALPGDTVCTRGGVLTINGEARGDIHQVDSAGRPLPHIDVCGPVPAGHFLPVSSATQSFDGRYFGFVPLAQVQNRVRALWVLQP